MAKQGRINPQTGRFETVEPVKRQQPKCAEEYADLFTQAPTPKAAEPECASSGLPHGVQQTSYESFHSEGVQLQRGTQKAIIYEILKTFGPMCQAEISERTGIPRHLIPDRLQQLMLLNMVEEAGLIRHPETQKLVKTYKIKEYEN